VNRAPAFPVLLKLVDHETQEIGSAVTVESGKVEEKLGRDVKGPVDVGVARHGALVH
jgi:hypothetical protein